MKKSIAKRWVTELRSGNWNQGIGSLNCEDKYCCLGVLSMMAACDGVCDLNPNSFQLNVKSDIKCNKFDGSVAILPQSVKKWAGLNHCFGLSYDSKIDLVYANDHGKTFNEIADIIEKNWRKL